MWQRIQTLYLALALVLCAISPTFNWAVITAEDLTMDAVLFEWWFKGDSSAEIPWFFSLGWLLLLFVLVADVLVLFSFKNRVKQIRLAYVTFGLHLLFVALGFHGVKVLAELWNTQPDYQWGIYLPVASIAFVILAIRGIRKDHELVKSIDRLR